LKILRAVVYGFGKWVDHAIDFSGQSVLIYGENESGKSTMQAFILFMLFGLPPKKRQFYRPKTSGKMGGRLVLEDKEIGEFTIERFDEVKNGAAVCFTAEGKEYGEDWLKQRLHGMTYETYRSVYAFSAMDLNNMDTVRDEDLGEILLGIGLTGSKNIYTIEKELDKKAGKLFKPYGTKPAINVQLKKLEQVKKDLHSWREKQAAYAMKKEEAVMRLNQLNERKDQLKQEQIYGRLLERKRQALPLLREYKFYREELSKYPEQIPFPEKGKERLEKQRELLLPLKSEYDFLTNNISKYEQKIVDLKTKEIPKLDDQQAKQLLKDKSFYETQKNQLIQRLDNERSKREQLQAKLESLSLPLNIDQLTELQFPFYTENSWQQIKSEGEQLQIENEKLETEGKEIKEEHQFLSGQITERKTEMLSENELDQLKAQVDLTEEEQVRVRLQAEKEEQREKWKKMYEQEEKKRKRHTILFGALALLAAGFALFQSIDWLYPAALILFLLAVGNGLLGKRSLGDMERLLQTEEQHVEQVGAGKEDLAEMKRRLEEQEKLYSDLTMLQNEMKMNAMAEMKLDERKRVYQERKQRWLERVQEQRAHYPFLQEVQVAYWPELYHRLETLIEAAKELEEEQQATRSLHKQVTEYEQKLLACMQRVDRNDEETNDPLARLTQLQSIVEAHEAIANELQQTNHALSKGKEQLKDVIQRMKVYEQEIHQLLQEANVKSIEHFYEQAKIYEEKEKMETSLKKTEQQLYFLFAEEEWKQWLAEPLEEQSLKWEYEESSEKQEELEKEIETNQKELAQIQAEMASLEMSDTYSALMQQHEMEKETLEKMAKDWAVLKTAKEMLLQTKRHYRNKYLTKIIDRTSRYFRIATTGKYKRVLPPTEDSPFQVLTEEEIRYAAGELSKGTIDLLYITLRLAVNEVMSEQHELPFMLDDPLVHFDQTRTKQMLDIIENISGRNQVILFTCKSELIKQPGNLEIIYLEQVAQPL